MPRRASIAASCLFALACAANDADRPPAPPDCEDSACNPRPGGGVTGRGGGGSPDGGDLDAGVPPATDGDVVTVTVPYTVRQTVDSWFFASANYAGAVTVRAVGPNGEVAPANDAGALVPQTVSDVVLGQNWFLVEDATSTRRIASTLQRADIDQRAPSADLRAISTDGVSNLVIDQVLWAPLRARPRSF